MAIRIERGENSEYRYTRFITSQSPFQVKVLEICFMNPLQNQFHVLIGRSFTVLYYVSHLLAMIAKLIENMNKKGIDTSFAEGLFQISVICVVLYNYIYWSFSNKKVLASLSILSQIYESNGLLGNKIVENILEKSIAYSSILTNFFIPMGLLTGIAPLSIPILSSWILPGNQTFHKTLPLLYDFHINTDEYFYLLYAMQFITISHVFCIIISLNFMQCTHIGVIVGQLQCMQYYLKGTDIKYYKFYDNKKKAYNFLIERLKKVIKKHYKCIKAYKLLESMTNSIMFVTLLGTSIILVISGTSAVISINTDFILAAKMMVVHVTAITVVIAICTPSQILYNASYKMFIQCYCIKWYEYPPKARIFMILLLVRTQKTFVLKAQTFIDLNFETCSAVIKKSLSFIATFRSLYATL